jgi:hypothetical protein
MTTCLTIDLGLIPYPEAYALQKRIVAARKSATIDDVLLLCEHPHVITQGRNGRREHLLVGENILRQKGVAFHETSRGGDVTYHGPGQIVAYPILNLAAIRRDVVWGAERIHPREHRIHNVVHKLPRSWGLLEYTSVGGSPRMASRTTFPPICVSSISSFPAASPIAKLHPSRSSSAIASIPAKSPPA